jgi:N-acetylmuramoyl-L-alanine amidase
MKKILNYMLVFLCLFALSSCASGPSAPVAYVPAVISPPAFHPVIRQDIHHIVAPGETLWHISRAYDVPIEDIMQANSLSRRDMLIRGQDILIPSAAPVRPVIPLFPSQKWEYIIIHHTATDQGSALLLDESHKNRGWKSLGYHFIINNGTQGKPAGHLETSLRWLHQENGAHCKASNMNRKGIGIAIVGNYSNEKPDQKQLDTLVYTVNLLKRYYNIPTRNIMGHRDVPGAKTECPGKYFPWQTFINRLEE